MCEKSLQNYPGFPRIPEDSLEFPRMTQVCLCFLVEKGPKIGLLCREVLNKVKKWGGVAKVILETG